MIVLDTTVLVYAVGADHPLRAPALAMVEGVAGGRLRATTSVEVLQEFAHVRARRRTREDAARLARAFRDLLEPLLAVVPADLDRGLDSWVTHGGLGAFDAVLAAAAARIGATALVSADSAFAAIDKTPYVPLSSAVTAFGLNDSAAT